MTLTAFAPASIGNVSLGFDVLGAALQPVDGTLLGDQVSAEPSEDFSLSVTGPFADKLPGDADSNIVTRCYHHFNQALAARGQNAKTLHLTLQKNLPIGSGLGSSASSIVAALHALNAFYGEPFDQHALLLMMGELEGEISGSVHYDNVAPCYLGGMTLMVEEGDILTRNLPVFEDWYWVICYSGISVSTSAAREILPTSVSMQDTLTFGRRLAVFVDALHRADRALAAKVIEDVLAEPHRKQLLPGFDRCKQTAIVQGALAFGISGSGPTVFAVCDTLEKARQVQATLDAEYTQNAQGFSHICRLDTAGARTV